VGRRWGALLLVAYVSACAAPPHPPSAKLTLEPVGFASLPGWEADRQAAALAAFLQSCRRILALPPGQSMGPNAVAGLASDWQGPCREAAELPPGEDRPARDFFETAFRAYRLGDAGASQGFFTGYYMPRVAGSRLAAPGYPVPLYRRPPELEEDASVPYYTRKDIDGGALAGRGLELVWLASPVDAFFIQVQGSAEVALPDGVSMRVGVAGTNGRSYVAIGRILAARGEIAPAELSLQSVRAWLIAHPRDARSLMEENPRYVFFRELPGPDPLGSEGVPLTAGRSLAVDPGFLPFGAPIYVDTVEASGAALRRLMLAQDSGGAIKGPLRADIYWGAGGEAEARAGAMKSPGRLFLLLPRELPLAAGT
jgi:membrane-bound lytic murein transglycosylase A